MKKIVSALVISCALLLQACGDRPQSSTTTDTTEGAVVFGPTGENVNGGDPQLGAALPDALSVHAISDKNSILTGGTDVATVTVLVTDESNRAKAGEQIDFSSTGGVLQDIVPLTDVNGEASAVLNLARDYRNQDITVTAASGSVIGEVTIASEGSEVSMAGPSSLVLGDEAELTVTLKAGNGEPIANEPVILTSAAGNTITPAEGNTDSNGNLVITVTSDAGSDTVTASALEGTAVISHELTVANDILEFLTPTSSEELEVGSVTTVEVFWESEGAPVVGEDLRFGITAGQILGGSVATTNMAGIATIEVTSSSAGPATVSVASDEDGDPATQLEIEFIATTPATVGLSASSTRVPTTDTSTITALVTDANGNPVKNQEVIFASADLKGGQLNPASAISDSSGQARVTFTAGNQATVFEAVEIVAQVQGTTIVDSTRLTVVERVLNVTIGTTDLIRSINGETQYSLPFVVQVADGGGSPLEGASVEVSIRPVAYRKGYARLVNSAGQFSEEVVSVNGQPAVFQPDRWVIRSETSVTCQAEDLNGNRILDAGEDLNNNGSLDPQDPALVAADSVNSPTVEGGTITTDATGSGFFAVIYPQSNAQWAFLEITARAKALGVEAEATFSSGLPILGTEIDDTNTSPPNRFSPYGTQVTPPFGDAALDCVNEL